MTANEDTPSDGQESSGIDDEHSVRTRATRRGVLTGVVGLAALSTASGTSVATDGVSGSAGAENGLSPSDVYSATTTGVFAGLNVDTSQEDGEIHVEGYPGDDSVSLQLDATFGTTGVVLDADRARTIAWQLLEAADHAELPVAEGL